MHSACPFDLSARCDRCLVFAFAAPFLNVTPLCPDSLKYVHLLRSLSVGSDFGLKLHRGRAELEGRIVSRASFKKLKSRGDYFVCVKKSRKDAVQ
jgi:hypothetical protein